MHVREVNPVVNSTSLTVRGAGDQCYQFRISTCTVFISESVNSPLITPVTGAPPATVFAGRVWPAALPGPEFESRSGKM